jgi:hypothetical protein
MTLPERESTMGGGGKETIMRLKISAGFALAAIFVAPIADAFAQAPKTAVLSTAKVTGGTVEKKTTIVSAVSDAAATLTYTDAGGQKKTVKVAKGDKIAGLQIESGRIIAATASGGTLSWGGSLTLKPEQGTVEADSLKGTLLKDLTLEVKVSATQQSLKVNDTEEAVKGDFEALPALQLRVESLGIADVDKPVVPQSLVQATQLKRAATEAANISTVGDYFKFNVDISQFRPTDPGTEVTAPRGSCFRVSQELDEQDPSDPSKTRKIARGRFETGLFEGGWFPRLLLPPYLCKSKEALSADTSGDAPRINTALSYDVPRSMILEDRDRDRFGWTYGALVAPFKFYTKERQFSAGAAVGPYLGYRLHDRQGSSSVLAVAIGVATATVKTNNADGTSSDSNTTGLTAAVAYLLDIKGTFNVGLIAGWDYFSKSQNIANSGDLWLGLSFGYKAD